MIDKLPFDSPEEYDDGSTWSFQDEFCKRFPYRVDALSVSGNYCVQHLFGYKAINCQGNDFCTNCWNQPYVDEKDR